MRPLVWLRADLRVMDNPALHRACAEADRGVVAVFCVCPDQWRDHDWAEIRVDFILRSLEALQRHLHRLKIPLLITTTDGFRELPDALLALARRHECDAIFFNREYEINESRRDRAVAGAFERQGLDVRAFTDQVVIPPGSLQTGKGGFYTVFTPFKRAWIDRVGKEGVPSPLGRPRRQSSFVCASSDVPEMVSGFDRPDPVPGPWKAGEEAARRRLRAFIGGGLEHYRDRRDLPAEDGTSRLSPHLAVGSISVRQCLAAAVEANGDSMNGRPTGPATWISELIWREFYRHILVGYPRVCMHRPFQERTDALPWRHDDDDFDAWCEGRTGVPIVDAAMRQLRETGWMHNRLRMITAMFLAKDLFIDWRHGERHFMRHLIDGDLASNNGGWQWSASTGTDAAPYFRIFNPFSQSRKCDPEGTFIRRFVPELRDLDTPDIHDPASSCPELLPATLDYPAPIVDHRKARQRAIDAFKKLR